MITKILKCTLPNLMYFHLSIHFHTQSFLVGPIRRYSPRIVDINIFDFFGNLPPKKLIDFCFVFLVEKWCFEFDALWENYLLAVCLKVEKNHICVLRIFHETQYLIRCWRADSFFLENIYLLVNKYRFFMATDFQFFSNGCTNDVLLNWRTKKKKYRYCGL